MDVGNVGGDIEDGGIDVDAVGAHTRCSRCSGFGHLARDCATPADVFGGKGGVKGGGKGGGGKGGESAVAGGKSGGKGKGGSKGYQGSCWKCGKVGHK